MSNSAARKPSTIADLLALPESTRADLIRGEIILRTEPSVEHEGPVLSTSSEIYTRFRGPSRPGGGGGWWIFTNTLIDFDGEALCPDIAGWRRERVPQKPAGFPVRLIPDWICEVSCTTRRKDTTDVPRILHAAEVGFYWRIDVPDQNLTVHEWSPKGFVVLKTLYREDGNVRIPPFDAVELNVGQLLGDDPLE